MTLVMPEPCQPCRIQVVIDAGALRRSNRIGQGANVGCRDAVGAALHESYFFAGSAPGFCAPAGSFRPASTAFRIGLIVRRYAKMAFKSSSVMFW